MHKTPYDLSMVLRSNPLFGLLEPSERARLIKNYKVISCDSGSPVFLKKQIANDCYFLLEGLVNIEAIDPVSKRKYIKQFIYPGQIFGIISVVAQRKFRIDQATFLQKGLVLSFPKEILFLLVESNLKFTMALFQLINVRGKLAQENLSIFVDKGYEGLVMKFILQQLESKKDKISISQFQLSDFIGVSQQTISHVLRKFARNNLIKLERGIIHINRNQFQLIKKVG